MSNSSILHNKRFYISVLAIIALVTAYAMYSPSETSTGNEDFRNNDAKFVTIGAENEIRSFNCLQKTTVKIDTKETNVTVSGKILFYLDIRKDDNQRAHISLNVSSLEGFQFLDDDVLKNKISNDLAEGLDVFLSNEGKITDIFIKKDFTPAAVNILSALLYEFQFVNNTTSTHSDSWATEEKNTTGLYFGLYKKNIEKDNLLEITKQKERYYILDSKRNSTSDQIIVSPDSKAHFSIRDGHIEVINSFEKLEVKNQFARMNSTNKTLCSLEEIKKNQRLQNLKNVVRSDEYERLQNMNAEKENLVKMLNGQNLKDLQRKMTEMNFKTAGKNRILLFHEIIAYFKLKPEKIQELAEWVNQLDRGHRYYRDMLSILFGVFTELQGEEVEKTLIQLIQTSIDDKEVRLQAIGALHHFKNPSEFSITNTFNLLQNTNDQEIERLLTLSLGSLVKNLSPEKSEQKSRIANYLQEEYEKNNTEEKRIVLIDSMGNSALPQTLNTLKRILINGTEREKLSAILALRNNPKEEAKEILIKHLESTSENLRIQALRSLSSRETISERDLHRLINSYSTFTTEEGRIELLRTVHNFSLFFPNRVKLFLEQIIKGKDTAQIKRFAEKLLTSI